MSQDKPGNVDTEQTRGDLVLAAAPSLLDESGDVIIRLTARLLLTVTLQC